MDDVQQTSRVERARVAQRIEQRFPKPSLYLLAHQNLTRSPQASIRVDPQVGQAIARGWDWQRRRKARFLEWLRSPLRTESPCVAGLRVVLRSHSPEAGVSNCIGVTDEGGVMVWAAWWVAGELGLMDPVFLGFDERAMCKCLFASPQWAQIFNGVAPPRSGAYSRRCGCATCKRGFDFEHPPCIECGHHCSSQTERVEDGTYYRRCSGCDEHGVDDPVSLFEAGEGVDCG